MFDGNLCNECNLSFLLSAVLSQAWYTQSTWKLFVCWPYMALSNSSVCDNKREEKVVVKT